MERNRPGSCGFCERSTDAGTAEEAAADEAVERGPRSPPGPGIPVPPIRTCDQKPEGKGARPLRYGGPAPGFGAVQCALEDSALGAATEKPPTPGQRFQDQRRPARDQYEQSEQMLPTEPHDPRPRNAEGTDTKDIRSPAFPACGSHLVPLRFVWGQSQEERRC